ncbi:MAG: ABC transporter permease [Bacteroidota bacterium]
MKESVLYLILLLLLVISAFTSKDFLTVNNISNLLLRCSFNGLISLGMTFVILVAGIDLSVGAIFAFAGVFLATMLHGSFFKYMPSVDQSFQAGGAIDPVLPLFFMVVLVLLAGAFFGLLNGLLVTKAKMQAFAATLGIMVAVRGLAFTYSGGFPIPKVTEEVMWLGNGEIAGFPVPVVFWFVASLLSYIVLRHTVFGQSVYTVGAGVKAAWMSGIKVDWVKIRAYMISGFLSALAGVLMIGRMNAAEPREGSGYELDAIAAVVIGGTLLSGGKGSVLGTIAGVIILGLIANILNLINVPPYPQQIAKGLIILVAVLIQRLAVKGRR